MKVQASVKKMCKNCAVRIRNGRRVITCIHPKHKQRQG